MRSSYLIDDGDELGRAMLLQDARFTCDAFTNRVES